MCMSLWLKKGSGLSGHPQSESNWESWGSSCCDRAKCSLAMGVAFCEGLVKLGIGPALLTGELAQVEMGRHRQGAIAGEGPGNAQRLTFPPGNRLHCCSESGRGSIGRLYWLR